MNDYGSTSRGRPLLKSPLPHNNNQDSKTLRKKYDQLKETLKMEKKNSESLQLTIRQLKEINSKQEKQLGKKQEQIDILLDQIKYLKNVITQNKSKKTSQENSWDDKPPTNNSGDHEEKGKVGGYFGSIFK